MTAPYFRIPFGTDGDLAAIPITTQVDGSLSYQQGFGPDFSLDPDSGPPSKDVPRDQTNQLYFDITTALQQYQQHGVPDFITTSDNGGTAFSYSQYARVLYDSGSGFHVYESLADSNNTLPTDATKWRQVSASDEVYYGTTTNVADTYDCPLTPPLLTSYEQGKLYIVQFNSPNSASTVTLNLGPGAKSLRDAYGANPTPGFITATSRFLVCYDGTNLRILGQAAIGQASTTDYGTVKTATASDVANQTNTGNVPTVAALLGLTGLLKSGVTFSGTIGNDLSGTYSRTLTTVTVTATAHGLIPGNKVQIDFTTGSALDGLYDVLTVPTANTFTIATVASGTTSGNANLPRRLIYSTKNVNNVCFISTANYWVNYATEIPTPNFPQFVVGAGGNAPWGNIDDTRDPSNAYGVGVLGSTTNGTTRSAAASNRCCLLVS